MNSRTLIGLVWYPSNPGAQDLLAVLGHADASTDHRDRAVSPESARS